MTYNNNLSTVGYSSITVIWGARSTASFTQPVTFQWSSNGSTWNTVTYTQVTADASWYLVNGGTRISLGTTASGVTNLQFRWQCTVNNSGTYSIDDFSVQGTASSSSAPTLSPDITANTVDNFLDITFTDDLTCRNAITAVKVGSTAQIGRAHG